MQPFFDIVESRFCPEMPVARFKHLCGEYCTASSFACWLALRIIQTGLVSPILVKKNPPASACKRILIYNNYRGVQHAFILMNAVDG